MNKTGNSMICEELFKIFIGLSLYKWYSSQNCLNKDEFEKLFGFDMNHRINLHLSSSLGLGCNIRGGMEKRSMAKQSFLCVI